MGPQKDVMLGGRCQTLQLGPLSPQPSQGPRGTAAL